MLGELINPPYKGLDLSGKRFGKLTAVAFAGVALSRGFRERYVWQCKCDCGQLRLVDRDRLQSGATTSCGCYAKSLMKLGTPTHGMSKSTMYKPVYLCWRNMRIRCNNPKYWAYHRYGGRGIKVCERWNSFKNFFDDMFPTWKPGLSLDRIDNDSNYCPENCRWSSQREQVLNSSRTRKLIIGGKCYSAKDVSQKLGGSHLLVSRRIKAGWNVEKATTTPPDFRFQ